VKKGFKRSRFVLGILTTPAKGIFRSSYHLGLLAGIRPRLKAFKGQLKVIMMPSCPYQSLDQILKHHQLDGLLILTWRWIHPSIVRLIEKTRHPQVLVVNDPVPGLRVNLVSTDTDAGIRQAVSHLIKKGLRRIGMLHGPMSVAFKTGKKITRVPFIDTRLKREGFLKTLRSKKIPINQKWIRAGLANTESEGERVMQEWLRGKALPEAILCGNDDLAFGALKAIRKTGKRAPQDVAIIGFDDNKRAKKSCPPLTTVHQPLIQMGKDAVDILIRKARRPDSRPVHKRYLPKLIVRKTA